MGANQSSVGVPLHQGPPDRPRGDRYRKFRADDPEGSHMVPTLIAGLVVLTLLAGTSEVRARDMVPGAVGHTETWPEDGDVLVSADRDFGLPWAAKAGAEPTASLFREHAGLAPGLIRATQGGVATAAVTRSPSGHRGRTSLLAALFVAFGLTATIAGFAGRHAVRLFRTPADGG